MEKTTKKILPKNLQPLVMPLLLCVVLATLFFAASANKNSSSLDISTIEAIFQAIATLLCAAIAFLLIRIIDVALWHKMSKQKGDQAHHLLRDIVAILIWIATAAIVLSAVFGRSVTALLAASTVAMGVIGFSLQRPILDIYAGIVLGLQKPFSIGDWIEVNEKGEIGCVVNINWRTVVFRTPDEITLLIPNSQFINHAIKLYSRPEQFFRDEIRITLPYSITTYQGQRILLGAANQIQEIAAIPRKSITSIVDYTDRGVLWSLLYWCPTAGEIAAYRFKVNQNILRNLFYAGINVPSPMLDIRPCPPLSDPEDEIGVDKMLARVTLFAALTTGELRYLTAHVKKKLFLANHHIMHQGECGDSLFVLREGLLKACITQEDGTELEVGRIHPGHFFGEKSLLLGEPRSASIISVVDSVVLEITKHEMSKLMHDRPEIASYMGEILSERQITNDARLKDANHPDDEDTHALSKRLVQNIKAFFGFK